MLLNLNKIINKFDMLFYIEYIFNKNNHIYPINVKSSYQSYVMHTIGITYFYACMLIKS